MVFLIQILKLEPSEQRKLNIAVEELFVNISNYANVPDVGDATIRIEQKDNPNRIVITFIDSGMPYNPEKAPEPDTTSSIDDRPVGGLGIYLAKNYVDKFDYERRDEKNVLIIEKYV